MGRISLATFKPRQGKEEAFLDVLRDHLPILRGEGLATDRAPIVGRAADGTILEVFEWQSDDAIAQAHSNPAVLALWQRYDATCEYIRLTDLAEVQGPFPTFETVDL